MPIIIKNVIFYRYTRIGPTPYFWEFRVDETLLMNSAISYYTGLSQTDFFSEGLFGPLPFDNEKGLEALVYSAIINDLEAHDPRMHGHNYVMIAFILQRGMSHLIERNKFSDLLSEIIKDIDDISKWNPESLSRVVRKIREN